MKKKFLSFGLMLGSFFSFGQRSADSVYKKQKISETDIQILFSYYNQTGDHSAVTGGIGTEMLHVYAPEIIVNRQVDSLNSYTIDGGADVITSASADNIDFNRSSASRIDTRSYLNIGYQRKLKGSDTHIGISTGQSLESAYRSTPLGLSFDHKNNSGSREIAASVQCYFDDLRWGLLDPDYYHPITVVYPYELRYKKWFTTYQRYSYNLSTALYQVINKRMQFAVFPELVYQQGLLCTPYHRVYFNDHYTEKVENLPMQRWKVPLGFQLNMFVGSRTVIRTYYRFYWDNFGITAHTLKLEVPVKISPTFTAAPLVRLYTQTAAKYFESYAQHSLDEEYYTSDYDLSKLNSYELGLSLRYAPHAAFFRKYFFQAVSLRYAYYERTDKLNGSMISVVFDINHHGKE